jgi:hypothetical protein
VPEQQTPLTTYGIRKDIQAALAKIRTDLDGFSDAEADALMLSGYRMMQEEFASSIHGFPVTGQAPADWRFLRIDKLVSALRSSPELEELKRTLDVAHASAFKPYRLSTPVKLVTWVIAAGALAGLAYLVLSVRGHSVSIARLLAGIAALCIVGAAAKRISYRLLRNPNPLWQILVALPMLFLGWPLTWIWTRFFDPIYLHSGPRYRQ